MMQSVVDYSLSIPEEIMEHEASDRRGNFARTRPKPSLSKMDGDPEEDGHGFNE